MTNKSKLILWAIHFFPLLSHATGTSLAELQDLHDEKLRHEIQAIRENWNSKPPVPVYVDGRGVRYFETVKLWKGHRDAVRICASLGMRLPTRNELNRLAQELYDDDAKAKQWLRGENLGKYWSGTIALFHQDPFSPKSYAYSYFYSVGKYSGDVIAGVSPTYRYLQRGVRCVDKRE